MVSGGRVLHHLAQRLPDSRNAVVLAGFQAQGTRGRALLEGARIDATLRAGSAGNAEIYRDGTAFRTRR